MSPPSTIYPLVPRQKKRTKHRNHIDGGTEISCKRPVGLPYGVGAHQTVIQGSGREGVVSKMKTHKQSFPHLSPSYREALSGG